MAKNKILFNSIIAVILLALVIGTVWYGVYAFNVSFSTGDDIYVPRFSSFHAITQDMSRKTVSTIEAEGTFNNDGKWLVCGDARDDVQEAECKFYMAYENGRSVRNVQIVKCDHSYNIDSNPNPTDFFSSDLSDLDDNDKCNWIVTNNPTLDQIVFPLFSAGEFVSTENPFYSEDLRQNDLIRQDGKFTKVWIKNIGTLFGRDEQTIVVKEGGTKAVTLYLRGDGAGTQYEGIDIVSIMAHARQELGGLKKIEGSAVFLYGSLQNLSIDKQIPIQKSLNYVYDFVPVLNHPQYSSGALMELDGKTIWVRSIDNGVGSYQKITELELKDENGRIKKTINIVDFSHAPISDPRIECIPNSPLCDKNGKEITGATFIPKDGDACTLSTTPLEFVETSSDETCTSVCTDIDATGTGVADTRCEKIRRDLCISRGFSYQSETNTCVDVTSAGTGGTGEGKVICPDTELFSFGTQNLIVPDFKCKLLNFLNNHKFIGGLIAGLITFILLWGILSQVFGSIKGTGAVASKVKNILNLLSLILSAIGGIFAGFFASQYLTEIFFTFIFLLVGLIVVVIIKNTKWFKKTFKTETRGRKPKLQNGGTN